MSRGPRREGPHTGRTGGLCLAPGGQSTPRWEPTAGGGAGRLGVVSAAIWLQGDMAPRAGGGGQQGQTAGGEEGIGACSAGPGQAEGSGYSWRCSASASPAEAAGPPRGPGRVGRLLCKGQRPEAACPQSDVGLRPAPSRLSDLQSWGGGRPYPSTCQGGRRGLQPETDWGADVPLPGPLLTGNGGTRGSSAPGQVPAQGGVWRCGWTPGGLLIRRDSCQSHRGATDRDKISRQAGAGRGLRRGCPSRVEALRLSPPPDETLTAEARGQAWTGAASLRPPWDRAEPGRAQP